MEKPKRSRLVRVPDGLKMISQNRTGDFLRFTALCLFGSRRRRSQVDCSWWFVIQSYSDFFFNHLLLTSRPTDTNWPGSSLETRTRWTFREKSFSLSKIWWGNKGGNRTTVSASSAPELKPLSSHRLNRQDPSQRDDLFTSGEDFCRPSLCGVCVRVCARARAYVFKTVWRFTLANRLEINPPKSKGRLASQVLGTFTDSIADSRTIAGISRRRWKWAVRAKRNKK